MDQILLMIKQKYGHLILSDFESFTENLRRFLDPVFNGFNFRKVPIEFAAIVRNAHTLLHVIRIKRFEIKVIVNITQRCRDAKTNIKQQKSRCKMKGGMRGRNTTPMDPIKPAVTNF